MNNKDSLPEPSRQIMYYSVAIGHHVGVMDCFEELMTVSAAEYKQCLDRLPQGEARRKLQGALEWDEIEINRSHADYLLPALKAVLPGMRDSDSSWVRTFIRCLHDMVSEPAMYLMVKLRA